MSERGSMSHSTLSTSSEPARRELEPETAEHGFGMKPPFLQNEPILGQLLPPQSPGSCSRGAPAPRGYGNARAEAPPRRPILHWSADLSAMASWRRRKPWSADLRSGIRLFPIRHRRSELLRIASIRLKSH